MNPITQALRMGHSAEKILQYLSGTNAEMAQKINNALGLGYSAKAVLDFIFRSGKSVSNLLPTPSKEETSLYKQADYLEPGLKRSLGTGAALLGGLGLMGAAGKTATSVLPEVLPALEEQLQLPYNAPGQLPYNPEPQSLPPTPGQPPNPPPTQPQSPAQGSTPQTPMPGPMIGQQMQQNVQQPINQAMQPTQATVPPPENIPATQIQPISTFDRLLTEQNIDINQLSPAQVQQMQFVKTIADKLEKEGRPLSDKGYTNLRKKIADIVKGKPGTIVEETARIQPELEKKSTTVGSTVVTPNGDIGEVKGVSNGKAIVEIDGKAQKIPTEELQPPTFSDDEVADAYDKLMSVIPEQHRSGFIQWAGYDDDRNVLGFIPRAGKYEELTDITPEEAKMIKEGKGIARTTGQNREGLWIMGEDTRGGIISQIIWDRRKKKKSEEEKQLSLNLDLPKPEKQDRGMKPIFDELGYAREKSREREKIKKLAEKQKMKREKDEAKKRKKHS